MSRPGIVADADFNILREQQLREIRKAEEGADTVKKQEYDRVADFAAQNGRFYAPATEDLWFKFATGSDGGRVSSAFVKAVAALSFRHFDTQPLTERAVNDTNKLAALLPSRPNPRRRVATDFAAVTKFRTRNEKAALKLNFVSTTEDAIIRSQPDFQSMPNIQEALSVMETISAIKAQSATLRDSINRGVIISSEMQVVGKKCPEGYSDMINRADDYVAFLKQRDHGTGPGDGRVLKLNSDGEISRSVAEVVFEVSDDEKITQSVKCLARSVVGSEIETARGDVITFVPLMKTSANISNDYRNSDEFKEQVVGLMRDMDSRIENYFAEEISVITEGTKALVKQVVNVINFSHLMWPSLVDGFLLEVREMCETLRITGDSIMDIQSKNYQSEYIEGILGRFREAEQEIVKAKTENERERILDNQGRAEIDLKRVLGNLAKAVDDRKKAVGRQGTAKTNLTKAIANLEVVVANQKIAVGRQERAVVKADLAIAAANLKVVAIAAANQERDREIDEANQEIDQAERERDQEIDRANQAGRKKKSTQQPQAKID
jgi:hypothetical protein